MRAKMWWQAFTAVLAAVRKHTPAQDEALRAERAHGVDRLGREVVARDGRDVEG
ncbi:hypothetical protein ACTWLT_15225 [Micromonospora sp. ZYX-F-536]|uniref:hypothetical protein n=1 Tax=Micromonospora sp. ZYX-F-536 TaxID=3457629 RepID=UPI0040409ABF